MLRRKKEIVIEDPFTQIVNVASNDVIVIKDDNLMTLSPEDFEPYLQMLHDHFPDNLVILLNKDDTFETTPIDELKMLLEDLIAHQEAVKNARNV